jgi:lysophospholipase L1-like esterase
MAKLLRLFVLGDSISIHYGPYLAEAVAGRFVYDRKRGPAGNLDDPEGANGGDSRRVLNYLKQQKREGGFETDVLLFNCGLHDLRRNAGGGEFQVTLHEYEENLSAILDEARTREWRVVWMRTIPVADEQHNVRTALFERFDADVDRYNEKADEVMTRYNVPMIDLNEFSRAFVPDGLIDHVHFDEAVRARQGKFIAECLDALF